MISIDRGSCRHNRYLLILAFAILFRFTATAAAAASEDVAEMAEPAAERASKRPKLEAEADEA